MVNNSQCSSDGSASFGLSVLNGQSNVGMTLRIKIFVDKIKVLDRTYNIGAGENPYISTLTNVPEGSKYRIRFIIRDNLSGQKTKGGFQKKVDCIDEPAPTNNYNYSLPVSVTRYVPLQLASTTTTTGPTTTTLTINRYYNCKCSYNNDYNWSYNNDYNDTSNECIQDNYWSFKYNNNYNIANIFNAQHYQQRLLLQHFLANVFRTFSEGSPCRVLLIVLML